MFHLFELRTILGCVGAVMRGTDDSTKKPPSTTTHQVHNSFLIIILLLCLICSNFRIRFGTIKRNCDSEILVMMMTMDTWNLRFSLKNISKAFCATHKINFPFIVNSNNKSRALMSRMSATCVSTINILSRNGRDRSLSLPTECCS